MREAGHPREPEAKPRGGARRAKRARCVWMGLFTRRSSYSQVTRLWGQHYTRKLSPPSALGATGAAGEATGPRGRPRVCPEWLPPLCTDGHILDTRFS